MVVQFHLCHFEAWEISFTPLCPCLSEETLKSVGPNSCVSSRLGCLEYNYLRLEIPSFSLSCIPGLSLLLHVLLDWSWLISCSSSRVLNQFLSSSPNAVLTSSYFRLLESSSLALSCPRLVFHSFVSSLWSLATSAPLLVLTSCSELLHF